MGEKEYHKRIADKDLDVRDMHLGINKIKTEYQPITYHFKDGKKNIKSEDRPEFAAEHLKNKQWGKDKENGPRPKHKIINEQLQFDLSKIKLEEVKEYLRKAKRRKAPGPDEIPLDFLRNYRSKTCRKL